MAESLQKSFSNSFDIEDRILRHCDVNDPNVVIPDGIITIASRAFRDTGKDNVTGDGQQTLRHLTIPASVTTIMEKAFYSCKNLESVTILGPATIGHDAFSGCKKLREVYLADGVKSLGRNCFSHCESLRTLFIPSSVETIEAFIANQFDKNNLNPTFYCQRLEPANGWDEDWNLTWESIFHREDSEFAMFTMGTHSNPYDYSTTPRHKVVYGSSRESANATKL